MKLEDNHMNKMMEINQLEEMANYEIGVFIINPTKFFARIVESMFHIDYQMHQSTDLSMDLEIEVESLCMMKCIEIYNHMKQWDEILLNKY